MKAEMTDAVLVTTLLITGSVLVQTAGGPIQAKPSPAVAPGTPQAVQRMIPSGGVDLRPKIAALGLAPRNQAPRPTCTIFATAFLMEYGDALAKGSSSQPLLSVEYVNWAANAGTNHGSDGGYFEDVAEGYVKYGVVPEAKMPYTPAYDPNPAVSDALKAEGTGDHWLQPRMMRPNDGTWGLTNAHLQAMLKSLDAGVPVAGGFKIKSDVVTKKVGNVMVWASLNDPANNTGAHSMALVGYQRSLASPGGGYFIARNSAGPDWGDQGYLYISFEYVLAYVADVIVFDKLPPKVNPKLIPLIPRKQGLPIVQIAPIDMVRAAAKASYRIQ